MKYSQVHRRKLSEKRPNGAAEVFAEKLQIHSFKTISISSIAQRDIESKYRDQLFPLEFDLFKSKSRLGQLSSNNESISRS